MCIFKHEKGLVLSYIFFLLDGVAGCEPLCVPLYDYVYAYLVCNVLLCCFWGLLSSWDLHMRCVVGPVGFNPVLSQFE